MFKAVAQKLCFSGGLIPCLACSTPPNGPAPATGPRFEMPWETAVYRDHPLVGRIWSQEDGAFVSPTELADAIQTARVVLLGERHDHPDHHRFQALVLEDVAPDAKEATE